jgi:hypothetical protein
MKTFSVTVNDLGSERWTLAQPFAVTVEERASGDLTACFYDADVYGYGQTIPEALDELKTQLVGQLEFLLAESRRLRLGPGPSRQLVVLQRLIRNAES